MTYLIFGVNTIKSRYVGARNQTRTWTLVSQTLRLKGRRLDKWIIHLLAVISSSLSPKKKKKTQKLNSQRAAAHIRKFKDFNIEAKKSIQDTKERQQQEVYGGRL